MNQYKEIIEKIKNADAILIGASNGLSITEGLHLFAENETFQELFGDFKIKYGIRNILDGFFYPWESLEEKWGFTSRLIWHYCGDYKPTPVMQNLRKLVGNKPYFVVTSNGEGHFEQSGFDEDQVYEVEGNWIHMRCSKKCHLTTYPTMEAVRRMAEKERGGVVPSELIPVCPRCGAPMELYNAQPPKDSIVQNWKGFLEKQHGKKIVILELGIGWRNQLIKAPFMRLAAQEENATYIAINLGEIYITDEIRAKSFGLDGYLDEVLKELAENL